MGVARVSILGLRLYIADPAPNLQNYHKTVQRHSYDKINHTISGVARDQRLGGKVEGSSTKAH